MSDAQRAIILAGTLLVLVVTLFPPYLRRVHFGNLGMRSSADAGTGHHSIFRPPALEIVSPANYTEYLINLPQLGAEVAGIVLVTLGVAVAARPRKK